MMDKTEEKFSRELDSILEQDLTASTIEQARVYLKEFPEHTPVRLYYGIALYEQGRYREGKAAILQVIKHIDPKKLDLPYIHLGYLYEQKGDFRNAIKWYRKAIDINPNEAGHFISLGAVLGKSGNLVEAEACHRRATKCKEGPIDEAYLDLGYVLRAQERYKEALQCFDKALEIDPKYKEAKQAIKDVKKALEIKQRKSWQA